MNIPCCVCSPHLNLDKNPCSFLSKRLGIIDVCLMLFVCRCAERCQSPSSNAAVNSLGLLHRDIGKFETALEYFEKALVGLPDGHSFIPVIRENIKGVKAVLGASSVKRVNSLI